MTEPHTQWNKARIHWIHQYLRQVKERVVGVQLRIEWSRRIGINLILHDRAAFRAFNLPAALVEFPHHEGIAGTIFRANPVHVLSEIADLIERIPNRKLELALRSTRRKNNLHLNQMLLRG